ncbi:MAG: ATP-binding protein [Desulfobulbaceae bacterium]|nr:ATP-binding protein [Desulfobulbaceae bacterium]
MKKTTRHTGREQKFPAVSKSTRSLRRVRAGLENSPGRYADLYDNAPAGCFILDPDGRITSLNPASASMLGKERAGLVGKYFRDLVVKDDREIYHQHFEGVIREKGIRNADLRLAVDNGAQLHVRLASLAVSNDVGETAEVRTIVTDITDLKTIELETIKHIRKLQKTLQQQLSINNNLRRSNEDLLHFAYIVSHDLQEPLRTVASFVQLLQRRYEQLLDAKGHTFMEHIVEGTCYMQRLLNDLLSYSRVGGEDIARKPVSLQHVLEEIKSSFSEKIKESEAEITSDDLPVVQGDEVLFSTLMQNLISNSLKYRGREVPRIHVSASHGKDQWLICIRDNGIGIDPRYAEQIFLIFHRLHQRNEYDGTGIGLAICKKIVERHGGRIWVESQPGRGSVFYFTIPDRKKIH